MSQKLWSGSAAFASLADTLAHGISAVPFATRPGARTAAPPERDVQAVRASIGLSARAHKIGGALARFARRSVGLAVLL